MLGPSPTTFQHDACTRIRSLGSAVAGRDPCSSRFAALSLGSHPICTPGASSSAHTTRPYPITGPQHRLPLLQPPSASSAPTYHTSAATTVAPVSVKGHKSVPRAVGPVSFGGGGDGSGGGAARQCSCGASVWGAASTAFPGRRRRRAWLGKRHQCTATGGRQAAAGDTDAHSEARRRIQELYGDVMLSGWGPYDMLYGREKVQEDPDENEYGGWSNEAEEEEDEGAEAEGEDDGEEEAEDGDAAILARSVVQIRTLHRVPNFLRPWEEGHEAESTSSGFVVEVPAPGPGGRPGRQLLLMTTAGAVEHARRVEVSRSADESPPFEASVAAVCLDLDVALLRVDAPHFWDPHGAGAATRGDGSRRRDTRGRGRAGRERGGAGGSGGGSPEDDDDSSGGTAAGPSSSSSRLFPLPLDPELPQLRKPVVVAGFPLGGGSLCVTSGVVSRLEVLEYSHSGRALLALQVDAPLNNGGWGGPALCPVTGCCVGMAFQKFTSQTWMERYDDVAAEMFGDEEDEEDGGGGGGGGDGPEGDGGGGAPRQEYDEDAENIGYLVPAPLLQLVLDDYSRELSHQHASTSAAAGAAGTRGGGGGVAAQAGQRRGRGAAGGGGRLPRAARGGSGAAGESPGSVPMYLDGRPRLGLRYQRMESPALRRAFGMAAGQSGVLVTGVDPTGSAAGVVQVHDVLLAVGERQVANDGTTLLRPGQRVLFGHWVAVGNVGDQVRLTVLRHGAHLDLTVRLRDAGAPFLPVSLGPLRRPQYLVVGPLVFVSFSLPYWYELMAARQRRRDPAGRRELQSGLSPVLGALEWGMPAAVDGEEVVLLTEVLECGEGAGSDRDDDGSAGGRDGSDGEWLSVSGRGTSANSDGRHASDTASSSDSVGGRSGADGGSSGADGADVGTEAAAWSTLLQGAPRRLATVNGRRVRNLEQLAVDVVAAAPAEAEGEAAGGAEAIQFLRLCLEPEPAASSLAPDDVAATATVASGRADGCSAGGRGTVVVLDAGSLAANTRAVLRHHAMGAAMALELRKRLATSWPFQPDQQTQGPSRQRRQQGRRVSLSGRR